MKAGGACMGGVDREGWCCCMGGSDSEAVVACMRGGVCR